MYREFFGLKKRPFILTPDPKFLYLSKVHELALTHLEYGIVQNVGFLVLTGEVGAGKTTLLKYLFEKIKEALDIAMIFNTNLDPHTFLDMLVREFELNTKSESKTDLFDALIDHFIAQYSRGIRCVIIVDEAQNLPDQTFEELRMLSNLEVDSEFIVQIILVGQPQLRQRLSQPTLSQLAQRISVYFHLTPLEASEVQDYIDHRLRVAGYRADSPLFDKESVEYIASVSKGVPRVINSICDASLTYAYADEIRQVNKVIVEKVIEDNELLQSLISQDSTQGSAMLPDPDYQATSNSQLESIRELMVRVAHKVETLEKRVAALEGNEKNAVVGVLEGMLAKEREKNLSLEKKLQALTAKYRKLQSRLERELKKEGAESQEKKEGKYWRLFSENKIKKK